MTQPIRLSDLLTKVRQPRVFVSYHHARDQAYYDDFARSFADELEVFHDKSLERAYQSDDDDYVRWQIRRNDITGSSCTIVLCGAETHQRKHVDWEIKATLDKHHGLIGIWLPTLPVSPNGGTVKPDRLQDNLDSGYAKWLRWDELTPSGLASAIETAVASPAHLVMNRRSLKQRNG